VSVFTNLRLDRPASIWQRRLFNGLAQVIVQSNGRVGKMALEASADGVARARSGMDAALLLCTARDGKTRQVCQANLHWLEGKLVERGEIGV